MSFIQMDLDNVPEQTYAPEGDYDLLIVNAELGESKAGNPQIVVALKIEGHPEYMALRHYIGLPTEEDEPETRQRKLLAIKRFLHLFNIPSDGGFNVEDFFGATARARLGCGEPNDNGDIYNNLWVPKIREE